MANKKITAKKSTTVKKQKNAAHLSPLRMGNNVLIRTVTTYEIGKVVSLTKDEVVLADASWVAHTGRLHNAMVSGFDSNAEVEPYNGSISIKQGAIVTTLNWKHGLPTDQK